MVRKIAITDFPVCTRFLRVIKNFASRNFLLLNYLFGIVFIGRVRLGGVPGRGPEFREGLWKSDATLRSIPGHPRSIPGLPIRDLRPSASIPAFRSIPVSRSVHPHEEDSVSRVASGLPARLSIRGCVSCFDTS